MADIAGLLRYIVPEMTMQSLKYRVSNLIEGNWREKAQRLLKDRIDSGEGDVSVCIIFRIPIH